MPKAAVYVVIWSPERKRYEWQHQGENNSRPLSPEDEFGLLSLVDGSSSFAFQGKHGHLTLRAEDYQRLFLDEGPQIMALLRAIWPTIRNDRCEPYVRMLLRTFA